MLKVIGVVCLVVGIFGYIWTLHNMITNEIQRRKRRKHG